MATLKYNACAYKDNKPWKFTVVYASCQEEAYNLAWMAFQKMGIYPERLEVYF